MDNDNVVFRFNCSELADLSPKGRGFRNVNLTIVSRKVNPNLKYMFQKSRDISLTMDQHATNLSRAILEDAKKAIIVDQNLKETSSESTVYRGRIHGDGKLTAECTYFEGILETSAGHIVELDLTQLQEYFLFPGQVVALVGRNNLGKCLVVSEVIVPKRLPIYSHIKTDDKISDSLHILVASGPFTASGSFEFAPVKKLITAIEDETPDVCILSGPFIDDSNTALEHCGVNQSFAALIQKQIDLLSKAAENVGCKLVIQASHRDVFHDFVYPTPAYSFKNDNGCMFIPDPAVVSIGGVIFGLTTTDILMHLSKTELASSSAGSDRMGRLCSHLLSQRNFYPVYPPDESVPFDAENWFEFGQMNCTPHVLVLPSELRYFIKEVEGCVVVNPQHVTKGQNGGFCCKLELDLANVDLSFGIANILVGEIIKT